MLQLQAPSSVILRNISLFMICALILYALLRAIFQLFFSPLSAIPGPWYAAVSNFWFVGHVVRLQQCKTIHELFKAYGPIVRVGPNKIVFRDAASAKRVYSGDQLDKTAFYKSFQTCVTSIFDISTSCSYRIVALATTTTMRACFWQHVRTLVTNLKHRMTTLEHTPHTIRKKTYVPHYASNHLALCQPEIHDFINDLIK